MFLVIVFLAFYINQCTAVIYSINGTEYSRMPPLFEMDDYESCLVAPESGLYCILDADLISTNGSTLLDFIHEYSAHTTKHFNHTQIHRALCVTKTCTKYIGNFSLNNTENLNAVLNRCVNDSVWSKYKIEAKVSNLHYCKDERAKFHIDISDVFVSAIYALLIILNVTGSMYDFLKFQKDDDSGNPYLLAFSIRRNWNKLTRASGGPDPRLNRLKLFNGLRTMTMVCVFFSHTVLLMAYSYVDNPLYIEKSYDDPLKQILFNGSLVTYTFFIMSSFLLAYNLEIHSEKHEVNWTQVPKGILLRWLRLTPTYALVLATISTWMRHLGSGPLWDLLVVSEANACRHYWWAHLLYINNYLYDDALCAPQTWYLASDTQMFCVGLLVCVLARGPKARKVTLIGLFLVSLVATGAQTYFQDLEAVVIQSPESYRSLYAHDATFRLLFTRGHANLSVYIIGLAGGFLTYHWQKEGVNAKTIKKYRWAYWSIFPLGVAVILSGGLFYLDGGRPSVLLRVVYATFYKPVFQLLVVFIIVGVIFKFESVYRGIIEWRGFTWTGRVCYSAFLLHTLFQRGLIGAQPRLTYMSDYYVLTILTATIFLSFSGAGVLWLCVEAPVAFIVKTLFSPKIKIERTKV